MLGSLKPHQRALLALTAFGVGTPSLVALIGALPKNAEVAAPERLALAMGAFSIAIAGLAGFSWSLRRYQETSMSHRYGEASSAVRDTLSYLKQERTLARSGQLAMTLAAGGLLGLFILAHWPQAAVIAPYKAAFGYVALLLAILVPVSALRNRGHYVNAHFLRRYAKHQTDYLGYRPRKRAFRHHQAVRIEGPGRFTVDGFEWRFDDFVKNALVLGQVGSGKTVCVLNNVLEGLIGSFAATELRAGGLILDAKGDFLNKIEWLCRKYGREGDLCILDPGAWGHAARSSRSIALNPLQNEDDALEVASRFIVPLRQTGMEIGSEGSFFHDSAKVYLRHSVALVRGASLTPAPSLIDVYRLSQETEATTPLYHQLINAIGTRYPEAVPTEITDAIAFMEREWAPMADRQKSGVRGTITQMLDEFLLPPFREIFTEPSTLSIGEMIDQGKILYVHMPASDRERMSRLVNTIIKLEYQRNVLKRVGKQRPTFMLVDEFQTIYTAGDGKGDSDFFERSRESNHANIIAAQNLSAFMKRTKNPHDVRNFIGNCAVKIMLRQTEEETNRWASGLFGQRSEFVVSTSEQAAFDGSWSRRRHTSYSRATRLLPRVPADAFTKLAIPVRGDRARQIAQSIVHLGSRGQTEHRELNWPVNPLR